MAGKLRAAVVGTGYLGRFHAQKYAALEKSDEIELTAVVDTHPEKAARVAAETGCEALSEYRELAGRVDLVSVVVPTGSHFEVASFFLDAGVDVLLEKPMTVTLAEADSLLQKAREGGRILQIGHLERFNPALKALRPLLKTPALIETTRVATFKNRGTDVSVVLDLMIHDLDLILSMAAAPLTEIRAAGAATVTEKTDTATAVLEFADRSVAHLTVSRVAPAVERKLRLVQDDGVVEVDFGARTLTTVRRKGEGDQVQAVAETNTFPGADALFDEIRAFVGHVRDRSRPEVSGAEGRAALAAALAVMEKIDRRTQGVQGESSEA